MRRYIDNPPQLFSQSQLPTYPHSPTTFPYYTTTPPSSQSRIPRSALPISPTPLKTHTFDNGINRTTLLTQPTINTLRHINIITSRSSRAIFSLLRLDGDGKGRTNCFAEFTRDTTFFAGWIATESMFAAKAGG